MSVNMTLSISVLSGKGGVGKTNLALNLGFSLHEPLLLRGVERPTDLLHSQAIAQIERFGLEAAEQATRFYHE